MVRALLVAVLVALAWPSHARAAASLFERLPADSTRALAMADRGQLDSAHVVVAPLVTEARGTGDRALLARAMLLYAAMDMRTGRAAPVMDSILAAVRMAEAARDTMTWMWGMRLQSMGENVFGRSGEAEKLAKKWLALAERRGDIEYQAWAHTMFGWLAWRNGDLPTARRNLEWALPRFEQLHHRAGEPYTLNVLSNVLVAQGEYELGRTLLLRQLELAERYDISLSKLYAIQNLGAIEGRIGDPARALALHRQAMEIAKMRGDMEGQLVAMSNFGELALRIGRHDDARKMAEAAIALSEEHAIAMETPWHIEELADALWAGGHGAEAKAQWRTVLARSDAALDPRSLAALGLAKALAEADSLPAALAILDGVLRGYAGDEDVKSLLLIEKGRLLLQAGRNREALALARAHAPAVEKRGHLELALAAWTQVATAARRTGDRAEAARAVAAATAAWESGRRKISDPEYRELRGEQAKRLAIESLEAAVAALPADSAEARARAAFETLQRFKTRTLLERMGGPAAFRSASPWAAETHASLARFQRDVLKDGELFLEYATTPDTTVLVAITKRECRLVRLAGEDRLAPAIELARGLFAAAPKAAGAGDWKFAAEALGAQCLGGVEDLLAAAKHVRVAADGALTGVPFALLVPRGGRPLIEDHGVVVVPSAAVLALLRARPADPSRGLLAFAGGAAPGREPLPGADREVDMLTRRFRWVRIWRPGVNHSPLDSVAFAGFSALHFAGHTVVNDQAPWRSGVVLGTAADGGDSLLTAAEIVGFALGAPAVVLSGCESAGGRARAGEGMAGLTSAFLSAGASSVIATLWPVDDRSTERLMNEFYAGIVRGMTVADALRDAQARVRADSLTSHPFYWAGFVAIGEPGSRPKLEPRPAHQALLPGVLGALAAAGLLLAWQRFRPTTRPEGADRA